MPDFDSWSLEAIYLHFTQRFTDNDARVKAALDANEKRLDSLNQIRDALSDQNKTFLPRAEFEAQHRSLIEKIERKSNQATSIYLSLAAIAVSSATAIILLVRK